jgi:hypothetical protein
VVDANILIRAVLGRRVRELIEAYAAEVLFFVPESAYTEAEEVLAGMNPRSLFFSAQGQEDGYSRRSRGDSHSRTFHRLVQLSLPLTHACGLGIGLRSRVEPALQRHL